MRPNPRVTERAHKDMVPANLVDERAQHNYTTGKYVSTAEEAGPGTECAEGIMSRLRRATHYCFPIGILAVVVALFQFTACSSDSGGW